MSANPTEAAMLDRADRRRDFVWGVSTSSYQIEGATQEDGRGASIWDTFCRQSGHVANAETGDTACDHYHRYAEDIGLMQSLGVQAYRFSVAWPRVLPTGRGAPNESGLAFYDRLIDALLTAGIEPWMCLYHWDLPQALDDRGGWIARDCAGWFADYAALLARRYGDRVKRFATFNEPTLFTLFGYGFGWHAPGIVDHPALLRAIHHVNLAHGSAVDVLRALIPGASIGAIHNRQPCIPATEVDRDAAETMDAYWNGAMPEPQLMAAYPARLAEQIEPHMRPGDLARICRPVDWFGLNHYSPIYAKTSLSGPFSFAIAEPPAGVARTGVGWPIQPSAFRDTLLSLHQRYRLPIYVMENGLGGPDKPDENGKIFDGQRIDYLKLYTAAMREAISASADVRGYFVWSLLDNFEWNGGYGPRFGLVYVDFATQRRLPKASFEWFSNLIQGRQL
ncbi:MAG TPA: GH1 family beta-glucosidase [Xanthobacteraceae bacterium]|jgi:beta-glucosidase|nr:GH1 family beta-glucosidase [Xanthobacteraceae bacterium]